jgi:hypothetical protein
MRVLKLSVHRVGVGRSREQPVLPPREAARASSSAGGSNRVFATRSIDERRESVKRFIVLVILSLSSVVASPQIISGLDLDSNWSIWMLTQDQDPHVSAPPYRKQVLYRWRRTGKPEYECEVEFRNPGTVARDLKYEISYQDNVPPLFQHHKYTGELLTVADAPRQVTIARCHDVDSSPSIYSQQASAKAGAPTLESWAAPFTYFDAHFNGDEGCSVTNTVTFTGSRNLTYRQEHTCSGLLGHSIWVSDIPLSSITVGRVEDYSYHGYWSVRLFCSSKTNCINGTIDGNPTDPSSLTSLDLPSKATAMAAAEQLRSLAK